MFVRASEQASVRYFIEQTYEMEYNFSTKLKHWSAGNTQAGSATCLCYLGLLYLSADFKNHHAQVSFALTNLNKTTNLPPALTPSSPICSVVEGI